MWQLPEVPYYYLAGPMRGYDEFNFPAFRRISRELRLRGYTVVSPHEKDEDRGFNFDGTDGSQEALDAAAFDIDEALTLDIHIIANKMCKGVVVMEGWQDSSGARAETAYAWATGRVVYRFFEPDADDDRYLLVALEKPTLHTPYGKEHDEWRTADARTA